MERPSTAGGGELRTIVTQTADTHGKCNEALGMLATVAGYYENLKESDGGVGDEELSTLLDMGKRLIAVRQSGDNRGAALHHAIEQLDGAQSTSPDDLVRAFRNKYGCRCTGWAKSTTYWRNRILKVAQDYKHKAHFAVSNKGDFERELEESGLGAKNDSKEPIAAAQTSDDRFPMTADFSIENLKKFVDDLLADKLEPYLQSEPVPEVQGNVKVVVGKNFEELITNAKKDVLIEFYAPWCGHCKKLTPIFDELGDKLAKEDVIIAKMDATANAVPPVFEVQGFPSLYWIPKGSKNSPKKYEGARELNDFVNFIAKESTDGLKGYKRNGKKKKSEL